MTAFEQVLLERLDKLISAIEDNTQAVRELAPLDDDCEEPPAQQEM